ncbi:MAG: hypothetical protein DI629_11640, partial [Mesorhizobium amorphae]
MMPGSVGGVMSTLAVKGYQILGENGDGSVYATHTEAMEGSLAALDPDADSFEPGDELRVVGTDFTVVYVGHSGSDVIADFNGHRISIFTAEPRALGPEHGFFFAQSALTLCFLPGTLIATPSGTVPVETLAIGDLVLTADGNAQ